MNFTENGIPKLRILGPRALVNRLPLPNTVRGGLYLLGREYPTLARVVRLGNGERLGYRRDRTYYHISSDRWAVWFPGKAPHPRIGIIDGQAVEGYLVEVGERMPIELYGIAVGDLVQFPSGEFQKWQIATDWAVMPISSLELVMKEER